MIKFLRLLLALRCRLQSFRHLFFPRLFGLRCGTSIRIDGIIGWPWLCLSRVRIGNDVVLGRGTFIHPLDYHIAIGDQTLIGKDCVITGDVTIGQQCKMSYNSHISSISHVFSISSSRPVIIGERCFLGANVMLIPGVELGDYCIVGANAVVKAGKYQRGSIIETEPAKVTRRLKLPE